MLYEIPIYSDKISRWTSKIDFGNRRYTIYFSWNTVCSYWEFSLYDDNEKLLVGGIRLVTLIPDLLDEYRNYIPKLPDGKLRVLARNNKVKELTRDNLNTDFALIYEE